jgi:hypothetical protein
MNTNTAKIFELLEANDPQNRALGIAMIEKDPELLKAVNERYLPFVRGRSRDPLATMAKWEDSCFSESQQAMVLKHLKSDELDLRNTEDEEYFLVPILGGILASCCDVEYILRKANELSLFREGDSEDDASERFYNWWGNFIDVELLERLQKLYDEGPKEGWYNKLIKALLDTKDNDNQWTSIYLDHTELSYWKEDNALVRYFWIAYAFILSKKKGFGKDIVIDVFQSDEPNLTPLFWLLGRTTTIQVSYNNIEDRVVPKSPLGFESFVELEISSSERGILGEQKLGEIDNLMVVDNIGFQRLKL